MQLIRSPEQVVLRFWAKVDKHGPVPPHKPELGNCWLWTACVDTGGYGHFGTTDEDYRAHQFAWTLEHGPIPPGMMVLHACDIRRCVRHLFLGTHKINTQDAKAKGRLATGGRHGTHTMPITRRAPLTTDERRDIWRRLDAGHSQRGIGQALGIGTSTVHKIAHESKPSLPAGRP